MRIWKMGVKRYLRLFGERGRRRNTLVAKHHITQRKYDADHHHHCSDQIPHWTWWVYFYQFSNLPISKFIIAHFQKWVGDLISYCKKSKPKSIERIGERKAYLQALLKTELRKEICIFVRMIAGFVH